VNGSTISGPFLIPVASNGKAAWVQANVAGTGEIHLYDLESREDSILSSGAAVPPVLFWESKVLWAERNPGGGGRMAMAEAETGEMLEISGPIRSLSSIGTMAATGDLVAWSSDYHSIDVWRVGNEEEERIVASVSGEYVQVGDIQANDNFIAWRALEAAMIADLRSGSMVELTGEYGGAFINGDTLLVVKGIGLPEPPATDGDLRLQRFEAQVVDLTELPPLPECPA
jgi:hypothetical protein